MRLYVGNAETLAISAALCRETVFLSLMTSIITDSTLHFTNHFPHATDLQNTTLKAYCQKC